MGGSLSLQKKNTCFEESFPRNRGIKVTTVLKFLGLVLRMMSKFVLERPEHFGIAGKSHDKVDNMSDQGSKVFNFYAADLTAE